MGNLKPLVTQMKLAKLSKYQKKKKGNEKKNGVRVTIIYCTFMKLLKDKFNIIKTFWVVQNCTPVYTANLLCVRVRQAKVSLQAQWST